MRQEFINILPLSRPLLTLFVKPMSCGFRRWQLNSVASIEMAQS